VNLDDLKVENIKELTPDKADLLYRSMHAMLAPEEDRAFRLENWPTELWLLKEQQPFAKIPMERFIELLEQKGEKAAHTWLMDRREMLGLATGKRYFIRLNTRSPKDYTKGRPLAPREFAKALANSSRTFGDMAMLSCEGEPCFLYVFKHDERCGQNEWRAFVKGGRMIALTQYTPGGFSPLTNAFARHAWIAMEELFGRVHPAFGQQDYVFDGYIHNGRAHFLEVNPYGKSDPCFFLSYENIEARTGQVACQGIRYVEVEGDEL
jgi:hypothetical protein